MSWLDPELYALRPWYHDFSALGLDTIFPDAPLTFRERLQRAVQMASHVKRVWGGQQTNPIDKEEARSVRAIFRRVPSSHLLNQPVKETHILEFVGRALPELGPLPRCLDVFCADGYYSCCIQALAPEAWITGVDLDRDHIQRCKTIARRLGFTRLTFILQDVRAFLEQSTQSYDLILCAGGLYHLSEPIRLLRQLRKVASGYLVVQSVVTLETDDEDYFVRPARGWQHGSRFTHAWLQRQLTATGWHIVNQARAELPGNRRLRDRGSSFFLCRMV